MSKDKPVSPPSPSPPPPPPVSPAGPRNNRGVVQGIIGQLNEKSQKRLTDAYEVPIEAVEPNPAQPRRTQNAEMDQELAEDIRANGILEPILVRLAPGARSGKYQIIAGERRYRAAKELGLTHLPAIIKDMEDRQVQLVSLAENLQRLDLSVEDEAAYFNMLTTQFNYSTRDIAGLIHKSQAYVQSRLSLIRQNNGGDTSAEELENQQSLPEIISEKSNKRTEKTHLSENSQMNIANYRPVQMFEKFLVKTTKRLPEMSEAEKRDLDRRIKILKDQLNELEKQLKKTT